MHGDGLGGVGRYAFFTYLVMCTPQITIEVADGVFHVISYVSNSSQYLKYAFEKPFIMARLNVLIADTILDPLLIGVETHAILFISCIKMNARQESGAPLPPTPCNVAVYSRNSTAHCSMTYGCAAGVPLPAVPCSVAVCRKIFTVYCMWQQFHVQHEHHCPLPPAERQCASSSKLAWSTMARRPRWGQPQRQQGPSKGFARTRAHACVRASSSTSSHQWS